MLERSLDTPDATGSGFGPAAPGGGLAVAMGHLSPGPGRRWRPRRDTWPRLRGRRGDREQRTALLAGSSWKAARGEATAHDDRQGHRGLGRHDHHPIPGRDVTNGHVRLDHHLSHHHGHPDLERRQGGRLHRRQGDHQQRRERLGHHHHDQPESPGTDGPGRGRTATPGPRDTDGVAHCSLPGSQRPDPVARHGAKRGQRTISLHRPGVIRP